MYIINKKTMIAGYNTNVPYEDEIFHVQTEDGGRRHPVITTLLYHQGAILMSKNTGYADLLVEEGWEERVAEMMKEQHKGIIRQLMRGKLKVVEEIAGAGKVTLAKGDEDDIDVEDLIMEYLIT
jgi:hypothetical protein